MITANEIAKFCILPCKAFSNLRFRIKRQLHCEVHQIIEAFATKSNFPHGFLFLSQNTCSKTEMHVSYHELFIDHFVYQQVHKLKYVKLEHFF